MKDNPFKPLKPLNFAEHVLEAFTLKVTPELFGIADAIWAERVVRQFDGTDFLRSEAKERLQNWYREQVLPHYFNNLERSPVIQTSDDDTGDTSSASTDGEIPLH